MGLHRFPMLKICCPLVFGILVEPWVPDFSKYLFGGIGVGLLACMIWIHLGSTSWSKSLRFYALLFITWSLMGLILVQEEDQRKSGAHIQHSIEETRIWVAMVSEVKPTSSNKLRLWLRCVKRKDHKGHWSRAMGQVEAFIAKDSVSESLYPGSILAFSKPPVGVSPPRNPGAFDYQSYLAQKQIYHQLFLGPEAWIFLEEPAKSSLKSILFKLTTGFQQKLRRVLPGDQEFSLAAALLTGQKSSMPAELKNQYAEAGVAHVLAVSGLHVGILAFGVGFIFSFLPGNPKWRSSLSLLVSLFVLILYALLTGLAPSVQRATLMYGLILVGRYFPQRGNVYNTLAFAASSMLILQPNLLFDLGFQLSFLAVLGIVLFQPILMRPFQNSSVFLKVPWSLIAVSIAAQLGTFPLTLFYFHSFPIYFWLSGLFVVPLIKLILYNGILVLFTPDSSGLLELSGHCLSLLIQLTNRAVTLCADLPGGSLEGISMDRPGVLILYVGLVGLLLWIKNSNHCGLWLLLGSMLVLSTKTAIETHQASKAWELEVYAVKGGKVLIDCFLGTHLITIAQSGLSEKEEQYAAVGNRVNRPLRIHEKISLDSTYFNPSDKFHLRKGWLNVAGFRAAVIDLMPSRIPAKPIHLDLLILRGETTIDFERLATAVRPEVVLLIPPSPWTEQKWVSALNELGWPFHNIQKKGAYSHTLNQ